MKCANTVIQLITKFWPTSIDALPDEQTYELQGVKPIFLGSVDTDKAAYDFLLKPECAMLYNTPLRLTFFSTDVMPWNLAPINVSAILSSWGPSLSSRSLRYPGPG